MIKGFKRGIYIGMGNLFKEIRRIIYIILKEIISRTSRFWSSMKSNSPDLITFGQTCIEAVLTILIIALSFIVYLSQ